MTVDAAAVPQAAPQLTAADLVSLGLSGGPNSAALRRKLLVSLGLPENLSTKMLLRWLDTDEKQNRMHAALKKIRPDA